MRLVRKRERKKLTVTHSEAKQPTTAMSELNRSAEPTATAHNGAVVYTEPVIIGEESEIAAGKVRGPWSPEEDAVLSRLVAQFGARNWTMIARGVPGRSGKSCRLRWCNQLDPCVKRKPFTGNLISIVLFLTRCF